VAAQRSSLAAADVPAILHDAFVDSYVAAFRLVMIVSAALGALGAACALLVEPASLQRKNHA
jgi:hypothetical protein